MVLPVYLVQVSYNCRIKQNSERRKNKLKPAKQLAMRVFGLVEEGGFEPPKSLTTDLQSAPFGHSGTPPYSVARRGKTVELVDGLEPPTC